MKSVRKSNEKRGHDIASGRLPAATIKDNFSDLHPPLTELQAQAESARCLFCHDAPCIEACPTDIDIPNFIRKISTGNLIGSATTILSANIMGGTCANVCPVEELCELKCVMNTAEHKPVTIGRLQRYATDHLFARDTQPFQRAADTGRRIAVIGAGPAGLSCAHGLAMHGHRVDVFEARPKAGGLNEYGIAAYKMLNQRAAREVQFILDIGGITLHTGQALGKKLRLAELRDQYDAVFLGLGHNVANRLGLEHEDTAGMHNAIDYIERIRQEDLSSLPIGRRIVVIGGGSTAIDIAVQSKKLGAESVTIVYRRGARQMSATWYEQQLAQTNGVLIKTRAMPVQVLIDDDGLTGMVFETTRLDAAGKLQGTGERFEWPVDVAFKAIGQSLDLSAVGHELDTIQLQHGRIAIDAEQRTSLSDVYAGGDCVPGPDLTVHAVQDGKLAAQAIHRSFARESSHG